MDRLTIDSIQECKQFFLEQLASAKHIEISLCETTEIDAAGIQLLVSLYKKCRQIKKPLKITGVVSSAMRDRLFLMGLAKTNTVDGNSLMEQFELLLGT